MKAYNNIAIAVDLHPGCDQSIFNQGIDFAKQQGGKITLVHAVEHINAYGIAQAYPALVDIEMTLAEEANTQLEKLKQQYQLGDAELQVHIGSPKVAILDDAKENQRDLIILGSHGRHGIQRLLGSTANAVLQHASCDVLAIRIE